MRTIKLTEEQYTTLENLLEYEIDQEYIYQYNGEKATDYLEDLVNLYEAIKRKQADNFIEALVSQDLVEGKRKLIEELKGDK